MSRISRWIVLSAVLVLLAPAHASAQRSGEKLVGLTGGATLSDLGNGWNDTSDRWGGTVGAFAAMRTTRNTVVQLEANWAQKGGSDLRLDYIEIPLTVGGAAALGSGGLRGRFYTGLGIDISVGCSNSDEGTVDWCDRTNDILFIWPLGFQIAQQLKSGAFIGVDARYNFSLTDALEDVDVYNRTFEFRLLFGKVAG